ncbi:DUF2523 domain-containing protein [Nevskia ramosa]|uniref:DUF2523 domain-containing protein n=1 Tax=Nevskia ramosa TaxID=64002 RepID=UPI003D10E79F
MFAFSLTGILSAAIGFVMARLITRFLLGLGIGYVAYEGFEQLIDQINLYLGSTLAAIPPSAFQVLHILNVETAINLVLSAYAARITIIPIYRRFVSIPTGAGA